MSILWYEWLTVIGIGALIGITDIISRYRDEPDDALGTMPSIFYLFVNAAASSLTLICIRAFEWDFGLQGQQAAWAQVLVAGFGAMAILRTSLWTVQVGEQSIPIGLNGFLDAILGTVDRAVDRKRAQQRAESVSVIMKDVDFDKAAQALPSYCFGLLQNLPAEEQEKFGRKVALLAAAPMHNRVKSLLLGLSLMNLVGEKVLETAVSNLGADIRVTPVPAPVVVEAPVVS
ncbi:MAG: hypothetical protein L6461_10425 [Anaerolineae bacterium]|nr:hypothetical protein [Anaerolineae bacterium]